MSGALSLVEAREAALSAALDLITCERHIHDRAGAASKVTALTDAFYLACRDVTNEVDAMPPGIRPRNWALDPQGVTA